jgi:glycosyltransferase involved in cell wall biosynthesis
VRLVHVGDIRPVKDQATLLSAADNLRRAGFDFDLDIVGLDTMNGAVQRSPSARSLESHVRWHGVLGRGALRALMERADILLMSSRHEAEPLVVLEAAVVGVPTVGTNVGHVADWAPHAAVAVAVGDADALARETMALVADEPRRLAIAREAQRRAIAIDADFTAATFERIYDEMRGS